MGGWVGGKTSSSLVGALDLLNALDDGGEDVRNLEREREKEVGG